MIIQPIVNIAEICVQHNIKQAVICPGSRSAPLTLACARHPNINTFVIPDERSAGFIGLGLAQSSNLPVAIICTSGTAVANLYPAIIEAYYQRVPLLILTADRPPEWIDQQDGQTIRQQNIYKNHILASFQFPVSFDHDEAIWNSEKMVSEAILLSTGNTKGPVHINVPIREPFYPSPDEVFKHSKSIKIIKSPLLEMQPTAQQEDDLIEQLQKLEKIMVVVGQQSLNKEITDLLKKIHKKLKWVITGDVIANIHPVEHAITHHDIILSSLSEGSDIAPDLLITFGKSVLSKTLKDFIRKNKPTEHWHVGTDETVIDTFKSLTKKVSMKALTFLKMVEKSSLTTGKVQNKYFNKWMDKEYHAKGFIQEYINKQSFCEFQAVHHVLQKLPSQSELHLANSMPVRYANLIGIEYHQEIQVWANRGTSGIDGCISTAVGHALQNSSIHTMLTGDLAFFYDRNSLWHNHIPANLRIVILNNHGGGIFRLINGPKQLYELEEYFETHQKLSAANTARDFGMKYYTVKSLTALPDILDQFFDEKSGASILEIETDPIKNQQVFEDFKTQSIELWK